MIKDPLFRYAYEEEKNTIGGLLLLFCATRTIISPIFVTIRYYFIFEQQGGISNVLSRAPIIYLLLGIEGFLTALGMLAGILIWGLRAWGIRLAKVHLIFTILAPFAIALLMQSLGYGSAAEQLGVSAGGTVIFGVLWFIYLSKSERVKHLYEIERIKRVEAAQPV